MGIFSIDLGDGRTKAAMADRDGRPVMVPNILGDFYTPSVVYLPADGGEPVVGREAENQAFLYPDRVCRNWKRKMGTDDKIIDQLTAREIAALVIEDVLHSIEERTGEVPSEITITVPASFTERQKADTIWAAEKAGTRVTSTPSEPRCGALGNEMHLRGDGLSLVVDIGSSTTDVSLIDVRGNRIDVIRTTGDPEVGGQDINQRIIDNLLEMYKEEHGSIPSTEDAPLFHSDLWSRVEQLKTTLSTQPEGLVVVRDGSALLNRKVTRKELESWISDLVKRIVRLVEETLDDAKVGWGEIETILAIGGAAKTPVFRQALEDLSGKNLSQKVEPDASAALGGVTAARIEFQRQGRQAMTEAGALPPINVFSREVLAHTLGVAAINGASSEAQHIVLQRGTPYPTTQVRAFTLCEPNQTQAQISVLEGDDGMSISECNKIGEFLLENLPAYPDLSERIEITFELSSSGLLTATARDLKSGITEAMKIAYQSNGGTEAKP